MAGVKKEDVEMTDDHKKEVTTEVQLPEQSDKLTNIIILICIVALVVLVPLMCMMPSSTQ